MKIDYMDAKISEFISNHWGTEECERIYRKRRDLFDDDYSGIKKLYESMALSNDDTEGGGTI